MNIFVGGDGVARGRSKTGFLDVVKIKKGYVVGRNDRGRM